MQPGEAFATRFSGTVSAPGPGGNPALSLNANGTVGSILDLRSPGQPPRGEHWIDEPQRNPVTAAQVGQVFGVALDDATPPNIYVTATSAFGIHRTPDNRDWMPGMWGPGGPGAVYRLDAANGYQPRLFARIALNGRPNSGPALGNIAYDRWNRQFFVSDLETGMIHRIGLDGSDRGVFDHGVQGRPSFTDAQSREASGLPPIPFDPSRRAQVNDCPIQPFDRAPQCWNFAPSGRRIWGLGVTRESGGEVRLYYAAWSGPAFAQAGWDSASEEDKRNSVWSVGLGQDGSFNPGSVRREFVLPDFFIKPEDIARAGYSQPVSDITFPTCSNRPVLVVAERGGIRNLGLDAENPFAFPHEARSIRYERDPSGAWRPIGRYDVGYYERVADGQPHVRANCSGGVAFGPGYREADGQVDLSQHDQYVWMGGNALCSPESPCNLPPRPDQAPQAQAAPQTAPQAGGGQPTPQPAAQTDMEAQQQDDSQVHGLQGMRENLYDQLLTETATTDANANPPAPPVGPNQSYLVDVDVNVDAVGALIEQELTRDDGTKVGDVAVYQVCPTPAAAFAMAAPPPLAAPVAALPLRPAGNAQVLAFEVVHRDPVSHAQIASHGRSSSHFRLGSHALNQSHSRWGSHTLSLSHGRIGSHNAQLSHNRVGSHDWRRSHSALGSHSRAASHFRVGSHSPRWSHTRLGSHNPEFSHARTGSHDARLSHVRLGSHVPWLSHARIGSHNPDLSHARLGSHNPDLSHSRFGSHSPAFSHTRSGSHQRDFSHARLGSHNLVISRGVVVLPERPADRGPGTPVPAVPEQPPAGGVHNAVLSAAVGGAVGGVIGAAAGGAGGNPRHNARLSQAQGQRPPHNAVLSRGGNNPTHNPALSRGGNTPTHNPALSRGGNNPTHNPQVSVGTNRHTVIASRGNRHTVIASRGTNRHTVIASRGTQNRHTVVASRGVNRHTVIASRGTQNRHNVVASRGTQNRHNVIASRSVNRHTIIASRGTQDRHNVIASRGTQNRHSVIASRGVNRHTVIASRGTQNRHNVIASRGTQNRHSVIASRGVNRHTPVASRGIRGGAGAPGRVTPQRFTPRPGPQRFVPPRPGPSRFAPRPGPQRFTPSRAAPPRFAPRPAPPRFAPRAAPPRSFAPRAAPRSFAPRAAPRSFAPRPAFRGGGGRPRSGRR